MSSTNYRNKNLRRPVKSGAKKNSKVNAQARRLVGLGVSEEKVAKLSYREVRDMLKRPAKVVAD